MDPVRDFVPMPRQRCKRSVRYNIIDTYPLLLLVNRRIQKKLLNYYEYKDGQKHVPGVLVKEFTRSAADARMLKAKDMRTELCLTKTVEYLLKE